MSKCGCRCAAISWLIALAASTACAQVFTVGEKSATADVKTDFSVTHVELPDKPISERGRRELVRNLEAEQGFAHRVLPVGAVLTLHANGNMSPGPEAYKELLYKKGTAAEAGDRVQVTALEVKGDHIQIDFNGGPYVKHRFLRHLQIGMGDPGVNNPQSNLDEQATGCRITLVFEGGVPDVSAPEVKALLEPIVDFGAKTSVIAYADTLPPPIRSAIASHEVLVGMDHRMVLAALGQPENKVREGVGSDHYEEWIYGHQPQTVRFVRFVGDRVSLVKIAALGKPIEVHDRNELAGVLPAIPETTVAVGDVHATQEKTTQPTLLKPGEAQDMPGDRAQHKVQIPDEKEKPSAPPVLPQELRSTPALN